jgi:hypothetical protein
MIKLLAALPLLFALSGCVDETTKINPAGGCPNGNCGNSPQAEPSECRTASTFSTFVGETFNTREIVSGGISYQSAISFQNNVFTYTQYCSKSTTDFADPSVTVAYRHFGPKRVITFDEDKSAEKNGSNYPCKAIIKKESFEYSIKGKCLILKGADKNLNYYILQTRED